MAVINDTLKQQAKELWLDGKKYKEISEITGIKESSIKSLASRLWKKEKLQPLKKKVAVAKKVATNNNAPPVEELTKEEIETLANEDLPEKQRLFCLYYSKSFNATSAYKKAYECDYTTALTNGSRLLGNARIKAEIMQLKKERYSRELLTTQDIFQKYMDIAFADITDFMKFGQEEVESDTGATFMVNKVNFKESSEVDGTLIGEVKQGKDGASIKLPDRMKALQWLADHMDMGTEMDKKKIALLDAQVKKMDIESGNGGDSGKVIINNDLPK